MNTVLHVRGADEPVAEHPEFQELCVLFSAGALSEEETARLNEHLSGCPDCKHYMEQFSQRSVAAMATLALDHAPEASPVKSFDADTAKKKLFEEIFKDKKDDKTTMGRSLEWALAGVGVPAYTGNTRVFSRPLRLVRSFSPYLPYAAGFLLALGLSLTFYWNGPRKVADEFRVNADRAESNAATSRQEAKDFSQQRDALNAQLQVRANAVLGLQNQIGQQQQRINELEATGFKTAEQKQQLEAAKETLEKNLESAQATVADLRREIDFSHQQQTSESLKVADLESRIGQLSASLKEEKEQIEQQDATIEQQRELLAHDRDIRDLMGARQLYMAEVYDSDENGKTKKPYARVFYTKDRSLIFYGFDLDRQPGLRNAATFQVWGRRGPNRENSLNLGILFQDSSTNKRWILKIADPMKLQQIDAVFVTIEPRGGSNQPTGKPLLFAYLRVDPNHP